MSNMGADGFERSEQRRMILTKELHSQFEEASRMAELHRERSNMLQIEILELRKMSEEQKRSHEEIVAENEELGNDMQDAIEEIEDLKRKLFDTMELLRDTQNENDWLRLQRERLEDEVDLLFPSSWEKKSRETLGNDKAGKYGKKDFYYENPMKRVHQALRKASQERTDAEQKCSTLQAENERLSHQVSKMKQFIKESEKQKRNDEAEKHRRVEEVSTPVRRNNSMFDNINWVGKVLERQKNQGEPRSTEALEKQKNQSEPRNMGSTAKTERRVRRRNSLSGIEVLSTVELDSSSGCESGKKFRQQHRRSIGGYGTTAENTTKARRQHSCVDTTVGDQLVPFPVGVDIAPHGKPSSNKSLDRKNGIGQRQRGSINLGTAHTIREPRRRYSCGGIASPENPIVKLLGLSSEELGQAE